MRKAMVWICVLVGLGIWVAAPAAGQTQGKVVTVTVTGMGETQDEAIKDGKRQAVEQVFVKVYSQSQTKDFELVKDTILTRSAGFVQSYKVLSKRITEDDAVELKMEVVVLQNPIDDLWGVVTGLLKDMGRPKIMVFIREKVQGKWEEMSTVQTRVEKALIDSGFLLVDQNQIQEIQKKDLEAAVAEDKPDKVQAIAKEFGAQIFISGVAAAEGGPKTIYGMEKFVFEGDANIKIYRSDTGQMLGAVPGRSTPGVQNTARAAAKQALDGQGQFVAPRITDDILRFWMDVLGGRGEVQLKLEGITFKQYTQLKKALLLIKGVSENGVNAKYANQNANISVECDMTAEQLGEKLVEAMDGVLDITDVSQNVIKAEFKKEK